MTTQTLTRVTLQTLENYRAAATKGIAAYRVGGHRLVGAVNGALKNKVYPRTAKVVPRATHRMNEFRGNFTSVVEKGIDRIARSSEKAVEMSSHTAAAQVTRLSRFAHGVDNEMFANGLQAASRLTMPGAKVALALSSRVAERASALADAAGVRRAKKAAPKAARKPVAGARRKAAAGSRQAKAVVKTATRRVAKVAKTPKAQAAKPARAARSAKPKAAAAA